MRSGRIALSNTLQIDGEETPRNGTNNLSGDRSMSDVNTLPAPDLGQNPSNNASWEQEQRAFLRLLPKLLATHRDRYIAVHQGNVIADGPDQVEVAKQAYARAGYLPIYVGLVIDEQPRPARIPSPRLLSGGGS
jgi:hypothetical protein